MPIRDYECKSCNHVWEELRKGQTDPEQCPQCGKETVERKVSASSFTFLHGDFKTGYERPKR